MDIENLVISKHAAERFHSRVRPTLDADAASVELEMTGPRFPLHPE